MQLLYDMGHPKYGDDLFPFTLECCTPIANIKEKVSMVIVLVNDIVLHFSS